MVELDLLRRERGEILLQQAASKKNNTMVKKKRGLKKRMSQTSPPVDQQREETSNRRARERQEEEHTGRYIMRSHPTQPVKNDMTTHESACTRPRNGPGTGPATFCHQTSFSLLLRVAGTCTTSLCDAAPGGPDYIAQGRGSFEIRGFAIVLHRYLGPSPLPWLPLSLEFGPLLSACLRYDRNGGR